MRLPLELQDMILEYLDFEDLVYLGKKRLALRKYDKNIHTWDYYCEYDDTEIIVFLEKKIPSSFSLQFR